MSTITPVKATPQRAAAPPPTDSPGTWRHPRLDEITRRRDATTFSEKNVRKIATNVAFLLGLWMTAALARTYLSPQLYVFCSSLRQPLTVYLTFLPLAAWPL